MQLASLVTLLSAFLLFQVQPLVAKQALPIFGGAAGVWSACIFLFQFLLLLGYAWGYRVVATPRRGLLLHRLLVIVAAAISCLSLWVSPAAFSGFSPTVGIALFIAASVALPFFLLSTTSILLQSWQQAKLGAETYRLYSLSNVGSFLGLLSFPLLTERFLSLESQRLLWNVVFLSYCILVLRIIPRTAPTNSTAHYSAGYLNANSREWFFWLSLPSCSSILLVGMTAYICQDLAPVPLLWVLPLALYLLSYIICFSSDRAYGRRWLIGVLVLSFVLLRLGASLSPGSQLIWQLAFPLTFLFLCCWLCHGELAALKPEPARLQSFYLISALGSTLGSLFCVLIAPYCFSDNIEFALGVAGVPLLLLVLILADDGLVGWGTLRARVGSCAVFSLFLMGLFFLNEAQYKAGTLQKIRNFYGIMTVLENQASEREPAHRALLHGSVSHGVELQDPPLRNEPTTYYGRQSGIGLLLSSLQEGSPLRIGVVGLGVGTLASYGRPGDSFTFYEINPSVIDLARKYFSFLEESLAHVSVKLGDARLTLQSESPGNFDILVVDAFSGDSIPVHLLTLEAFEVYLRHVTSKFYLVFHISNNYLDLRPVLMAAAEALHLKCCFVDATGSSDRATLRSLYGILYKEKVQSFPSGLAAQCQSLEGLPKRTPWTDSFSEIVSLIR